MEEPIEVKPLADTEREAITAAFQALGGNVTETARRLGIDRRTVYRKLHRYGLLAEPCPTCGVQRAARGEAGER